MENIIGFVTNSRFIMSAVILVAAMAAWLLVKRGINKLKELRGAAGARDKNMYHAANTAAKTVIASVAVILVLQVNDINITSLLASVGLVSAMIGLAMQDLLKDLIAGVNIKADDFFKVGDFVQYGGVTGQVIAFSAKSVKIENLSTGNVTTVSNRNISEITVCAKKHNVDIGLPYELPFAKAKSTLETVALRVKEAEGAEDCFFVGNVGFDASAIRYRLKVVCTPTAWLSLEMKVNELLQTGLAEAGIEIPFDRLDVHQK